MGFNETALVSSLLADRSQAEGFRRPKAVTCLAEGRSKPEVSVNDWWTVALLFGNFYISTAPVLPSGDTDRGLNRFLASLLSVAFQVVGT